MLCPCARHLSVAFALLLSASGAAAQDADPGDDPLDYQTVVTPSRGEESAFASPRAVQVVPQRTLGRRLPATTPEALEDAVGLHVQRTNTGGGAPIIRGLLGQHVLLMVDGIRMNNAITRFGPNQLLNTVDPFQIQRVEVVRGPGSVLYGSGALGGVVNLITRKPTFDPRRAWDASAALRTRYDSADHGMLGNLGLSGHLRSVGLRVGASMKRFDDLQGGRDTGLQRFTSYWEGDADVSGAWIIDSSSVLRLSYAAVRQLDAPRTDLSTPRDFRLFSEQFRDLATVHYVKHLDSRLLRTIDATLSFHQQRELRERFRVPLDRLERERDGVGSLGAQIALRTDLPYNQLTYGVDLYHDWVSSSADREVISSAVRTPLDRGRYVDDSRYLQLGVYAMDRIPLTRKLAFDLGARFSAWQVDIPADVTLGDGARPIDVTRNSFVGSLHGRYLVGDGLNLVAGVSNGYRAPNVDDLSGLGCSGQGFDVPNTDLEAEQAVTAEAGVKLDLFGILRGSAFYYFTYLMDQIHRVPAAPEGQMQCGTDVAGDPIMVGVFERDNAKSSRIHGVELSFDLALGRKWSLFSWTSWTRGEVTYELPGETNEPMGRTPPLNGLAGVRHVFADPDGFAELAVRWATRQDRLSLADRSDRRICPEGPERCDGTPGYAVVTLRGGVRLAEPLRLSLALENLTNATYRVHGSGIDGAGLSAIVGLEVVLR